MKIAPQVLIGTFAALWAAAAVQALPVRCKDSSSLDSSRQISASQAEFTIAGWAFSRTVGDPVQNLRVEALGKIIAEKPVKLPRTDVASAFSTCGAENSGFSFGLNMGDIDSRAKALTLTAHTKSGRQFPVGIIGLDFGALRAQLDPMRALDWNAENHLSGWALSNEQPVSIELWGAGKKIAVAKATLDREDVAKALPAWRHATKSGFDLPVDMSAAPLGEYVTEIIIRTKNAARPPVKIAGPLLRNSAVRGAVGVADAQARPVEYIYENGTYTFGVWLAEPDAVRAVTLVADDGKAIATLTRSENRAPITRLPDDRWQKNGVPLKATGGIWQGAVATNTLPQDRITRVFAQIAIGEKIEHLPGPMVLLRGAEAKACAGEPLKIHLPGVDTRGPFVEKFQSYSKAFGGCVQIGMQERFEYLRMTTGRANDYQFEPAFPEKVRRRYHWTMFGHSMKDYLAWTAKYSTAPQLFVLDGGVWADARGAVPDYDITDMIEQDDRNVQWNQYGRPEKDNALKNLAASFSSPELARMPTLNIYNQKYRAYKARNLKAAIGALKAELPAAQFAKIAIALDPDNYINPWFYKTQWYDYNPDTLRQFREWLTHTGPYAQGGALPGLGAKKIYTLDTLNAETKRNFKSIDAIDPPRFLETKAIDYADPLHQLFTQFKRHLVAQHYADLASWCVEAGLRRDQVFTGQTYIQTDVAPSIATAATGWTDEAGVSIEGAKPPQGSMGVILYGPAARNQGKSRNSDSLFANIAKADPQWRLVEYHPANISTPKQAASATLAYESLQKILNHGVRAITPMWGSHQADQKLRPALFRSYDAFAQTDYEAVLLWWLNARQALPAGALLFPFGIEGPHGVVSDDGFRGGTNTSVEACNGAIEIKSPGVAAVVSPTITPTIALKSVTINGKFAPQVSTALVWRDETGAEQFAKVSAASETKITYSFATPLPAGKSGWLGWGTQGNGAQVHRIDSVRIE